MATADGLNDIDTAVSGLEFIESHIPYMTRVVDGGLEYRRVQLLYIFSKC